MIKQRSIGAVLLSAVVSGGCGQDPVTYICDDIGIPSIVAHVRNQFGVPSAIGADLTVTGESITMAGFGFGDSLRIFTGDPYRVGGRFSVEVNKPWHVGTRLDRVDVPEGKCGVEEPHVVDLVIELRADAPQVRQVVLPPTSFGFGDGNLALGVEAYVEADEGVSHLLNWATSDSAVVSVTRTGTITSRCLEKPDSAWVIAASAVDTTVRDSVFVFVSQRDAYSGRCL